MPGDRRFARLNTRSVGPNASVPLPDDGLCLSTYLVLHPRPSAREVLLGRMDPDGPWSEAASLDRERLRSLRERWVLPATQLLLFEGPDAAADRIARELLGRTDLSLRGPSVYSEAYARGGGAQDPHWDLQFVYTAEWGDSALDRARGRLWSELRFLDVRTLPPSAFGRGHADVLALAGYPPRSEPAT